MKKCSSLLTPHSGVVTRDQREKLMGHKACTVWFTGLSGAGKSTLAYALEQALTSNDLACYVLDGDNLRHGLNQDLGFSPPARHENIRRVAEVAKILNNAGVIAIVALISPLKIDRLMARNIIGDEQFCEIFVSTPLSICERRDVKGLYAKARAGELAEFTGVSAPYEVPLNPDIIINSSDHATEDSSAILLTQLVQKLTLAS